MRIAKAVSENTKESYKQAILDCCNDLKTRVDDILCDFDKCIRRIDITMTVEVGCVSIISINKEVCVCDVEEENNEKE